MLPPKAQCSRGTSINNTSTLEAGTPSSRTTASVNPRTTPAFCCGVRPGYMCIVINGITLFRNLRSHAFIFLPQSEHRSTQSAAATQVQIDHIRIVQQLVATAEHPIVAHVQDVAVVGHDQALTRLLLHHENRDAASID